MKSDCTNFFLVEQQSSVLVFYQISRAFPPSTKRFSNVKTTYITNYFSVWSPKKRWVYLGQKELYWSHLFYISVHFCQISFIIVATKFPLNLPQIF